MSVKRKTKKKIVKRRNPMNKNIGNLRRWIYLNFPKYENEIKNRNYFESWKHSGIINDFIEYFDFGKGPYSDQAYLLLKPYAELWTRIQNLKITKNEKAKAWRKYLIDEPELFEAMYL